MSALRSLTRRSPLLAYVSLVFALVWAVAFALKGAARGAALNGWPARRPGRRTMSAASPGPSWG